MTVQYKGKLKNKRLVIKITGKNIILKPDLMIEGLTKIEEVELLKNSDFVLTGTSEEVVKKKIKKKEGGG